MLLDDSTITGMVKPLSDVDRLLVSQGFTRRGSERVTYNMRIADSASRTYYYLRIPAYRMKMGNSPFLRIEHPYISKQQGPERYKASPKIPNAIVEAAKHKTAEIASYLSSL